MSVVPEFGDNITTHELGRLLEQAGKAIQKIPMASFIAAESYAVEAVQRVEGSLKSLLLQLQVFETEVDKLELQAFNRSEEAYKSISIYRTNLEKKLKNLPEIEIPKNMNLYELKSFIEVADKLCSMNDRAWERMVRIMELYNARSDDVNPQEGNE